MSAAFAASSQIYFQGMAPDGPGRSVALRRFAPLILPRVLEETSRQGLTSNDIAQRDHAFSQFHDWREKLRRPQFANMTESQLEQAFNAQCLGALGYQSMDKVPAGNAYTLIPKPSLPNATPDVVLGRFASPSPQAITPQIRAVVELKGPRVKLDRPTGQNRTPVQQAFDYLGLIDGPELWAVVSNMHEFRLYAKSRSTTRALCFQLDDLADPDTFAQFYTAFAAQNLLNDQATHYSTLGMLQRSEQKQQKVGKELYDHYRENRLRLISVIRSHPLCHSFEDALAAAQRLLDRILFVAFAEDRGLLNNRRRIEEAARTNTLGLTPWRAFQYLFQAIDIGNADFNIPAFNGSLFKPHPIIDNPEFSLPAHPWMQVFRTIGEYDFEDEVSVTVLGHIFEQSITDIESLRQSSQTTLELTAEPKTKTAAKAKTDSARKTHGVYYTDDSVTEYLVAAALEPVWAEAIKQVEAAPAKPEARVRAKLARLDSLTLCDPACGSGAFLVAALKWFIARRRELLDELSDLNADAPEFQLTQRADESKPANEYDRTPASVLRNNLYGVDLSAESVEITRLSLWLYMAADGQKLVDLSGHIQRGNSVVHQPDALPPGQHDLAFDWPARFPEVFQKHGGFDVVVGNPPYVRQERLAEYKPYFQANYESWHGVADLYVYFYELGLRILNNQGCLGYITSGTFLKGTFAEPLRGLLSTKASLLSIIDFGEYQPFPDAEMVRPSCLVFRKGKEITKTHVLRYLKNETPPKDLGLAIKEIGYYITTPSDIKSDWKIDNIANNQLLLRITSNQETLKSYCKGNLYRGVTTGLNDAFIIDSLTKESLINQDPKASEIIKPLLQGSNLRTWYQEESSQWLIFTNRRINIDKYPSVLDYLEKMRKQLEPQPKGWKASYPGEKWVGRKTGAYKWYEIQDTVDYWQSFEQTKIVIPDIAKMPRASMDFHRSFLGNTGYIIPSEDFYLLGVINSWVTWFVISKTAQPLRFRGGRWQYRCISQFLEPLPIPKADEQQKNNISNYARETGDLAVEKYLIIRKFLRRITETFASATDNKATEKLQEWNILNFQEIGEECKKSFKLKSTPWSRPQVADDWESYWEANKKKVDDLSRRIAQNEAEINERVNHLFGLTRDEVKLLNEQVSS